MVEVRQCRMAGVEEVVRLLRNELEERGDQQAQKLKDDQDAQPGPAAPQTASPAAMRLQGVERKAASGAACAASAVLAATLPDCGCRSRFRNAINSTLEPYGLPEGATPVFSTAITFSLEIP